jgi:signal transduction histidine kinase
VELRIRGKQSVNNVKTFPVFDGYNVIGTIIIVEDMTEYDRLQKQLILSEKLASVGLLAAGVAHEINNPLEIISNYLSYLKYTHPEPDIHQSIDKVRGEIDYISKIVSNLVTFSDHGRRSGERVDVNGVIGEILDLLRYNAEYQHIDVVFLRDEDELPFLGDEDQLKQVLLNLIKNSFEATPQGGEIKISTGRGESGGNETTRIVFEDNGPGIDAEDPNTVFLPFFSTKSRSKKQLGLGLSISYRIVESFGGEMSVENLQEGGCRFTIDLPRAETDRAPATPES